MDFTQNRTIMGILAIVLVMFAVAVYFYNTTLNSLAAGSCTDASADCPHEQIVKTQNVVIAVLILVIGAIVAWIFLQIRKKEPMRAAEKPAERKKVDTSMLEPDEKKVIEILQDAGGSVFQSDVIGKLGYTKVKVSRILDRMEQRGLIERKRRGMANLVVLK